MRWFCGLLVGLALQTHAMAAGREVAITIDDLPRGGDSAERSLAAVRAMTEQLLRPFREQSIAVTGFVNEGRPVDFGPDGLREVLEIWLDAGADLGNHSYSHLNINNVPLEEFTADITRGEPVVRAALAARGRTLEYFRHPFLFTGPTPEIKAGMQAFLDRQGYRAAPVTLDNADYEFAALYTQPEHRERVRQEYVPYMESVVAFFETRAIEVVGREFPQILLLHANQLNADLMPELLAMLRRRGYTFVSLDQALADEAYALPDDYAGRGGFSWIHRWSLTKGMPSKGEPEPPAWVRAAFEARAVPALPGATTTAAQLASDPPIHCQQCTNWNQPQEPFRVFGNTYYVGTTELSALVIATADGLILLDGALPQSARLIDANIRALGLRTEDIRLIVSSHAHFDHVGGIRALQRASGATVAASPSSASALRAGKPAPDDPQFAIEDNSFPAVADVRTIDDGETLTIGDVRITAHFTPGHTPGGTSWSWRSCENERCLDIVYADSLNAVSADGFRFTGNGGNPSIIDVFERSLRTVEHLPCDILLSPHAGFFSMASKLKRLHEGDADAFVDPAACRAYASNAALRLDRRIAEEAEDP